VSPPGGSTAAQSGGIVSAEAAIKAAHLHLAACGVVLSPSKVSRLVRRFKDTVEHNGCMTFDEFLINAAGMSADQRRRIRGRLLDPVGDQACAAVMRERGY
jgi:hypothetical protein